jgi:hypothetical protein
VKIKVILNTEEELIDLQYLSSLRTEELDEYTLRKIKEMKIIRLIIEKQFK